MKKRFIQIVIILVIIASLGALIYASITLNKKNNSLNEKLIEINYQEFSEKINNKDTFILVITKTDCSHCQEYKPILKQVLLDYDITAYEIDEEKISDEEEKKLKEIVNISGTPTTVFFTEGEEKQTSSRIIGSSTRSKIISRLKAMGYIK